MTKNGGKSEEKLIFPRLLGTIPLPPTNTYHPDREIGAPGLRLRLVVPCRLAYCRTVGSDHRFSTAIIDLYCKACQSLQLWIATLATGCMRYSIYPFSNGDWGNALEYGKSLSLRLVVTGIAVSSGAIHSDSASSLIWHFHPTPNNRPSHAVLK